MPDPVAEPVSELRLKARRFYANVSIRPDHPNTSSFGEYFDRLWTAKGRVARRDRPEERLGYADARAWYVSACERLQADRGLQRDLERTARVGAEWARREHAAGRIVWNTPIPAAVLRAHGLGPFAHAGMVRPAARSRSGRRPAATRGDRGGDSGGTDPPGADDDSDLVGPGRGGRGPRHIAPILGAYIAGLQSRARGPPLRRRAGVPARARGGGDDRGGAHSSLNWAAPRFLTRPRGAGVRRA